MPSPVPLTARGGCDLRLWDHGGDASLPIVLFLHGFLDTGRSYDDMCAQLEGKARCLCMTFRGHGESRTAGPGASFHILDHVKDLTLACIAIEKEIGPIELIVGHSMGGNVALTYAGTLQERVKKLLLLDAIGPPAEEVEDQPGRLRRMLFLLDKKSPFKTANDIDDASLRLTRHNPGLSHQATRRMLRSSLENNADGTVSFPFQTELRGPTPVRYPEKYWQLICQNVSAETTVVRCSRGYLTGFEEVEDRAHAMNAKLIDIDGIHHIHVEEPELIADIVRDML